MAQGGRFAKEIGKHTEGAVEKASPWIERLARVGYAAHGTVYALVGMLALRAASGLGQTANQEGALRWVLLAPAGKLLLGVIVFGLLAYALWRLFQGLLDPENEGTDAKGIAKCLDHGLNGLFHASLAFAAALLVLGASGGGGGGSPDDWTMRLMAQPFGRWLTVIVGLAIVGIGFFQFYRAYKADFRDELKLGEMSAREDTWATRAGRLGYAARGGGFGCHRRLPRASGRPNRSGKSDWPGRRTAYLGSPTFRSVRAGYRSCRARGLRRLYVRHGPVSQDQARLRASSGRDVSPNATRLEALYTRHRFGGLA